ncbi:hypothetical protein GCM10009647_053580 [Streptomyces sanglieri]
MGARQWQTGLSSVGAKKCEGHGRNLPRTPGTRDVRQGPALGLDHTYRRVHVKTLGIIPYLPG